MLINKKNIKLIVVFILATSISYPQTISSSKFYSQSLQKANRLTVSQNWNWQFAGVPLGDTTTAAILIDPDNNNIWYVFSSTNGPYITRDGGNSWEHPLTGKGLDTEGYQIDPNNPIRLLVTIWEKLYISIDKGLTLSNTYTCLEYIHENYSGWNNIEPLPADKQSIVSELNSETHHTPHGSYSLIPIKLNIHNEIAVVHYYLRNEINRNGNDTNLIVKHYNDILINNGTRWVLLADHFGIQKNLKIDNHDLLENY